MTDSIDTSEREAEDPRGPLILPVREMRDEPVPHQPADPLRAALQLALEATPEELPAALDALRGLLAAPQPVSGIALATIGRKHFGNPIPRPWYAAARELLTTQQPAPQPLTDEPEGPLVEGWVVTVADGHSGFGAYAHMEEYPDEGAVFLCAAPQQPAPAITTQRAQIPMSTKYFRRIEPDDTEGGAA